MDLDLSLLPVAESKVLNWPEEDELLFRILFPLMTEAAMAGAETALDGLLEIGIGIDWALVHEQAVAWAKSYTYDLVKGINETSRNFLQGAINDWIQSGQPIDELINTLAPLYGDVRAEMISVTEVTRAFGEGNLVAWRESGVVHSKRWMTAEDELVCPICTPLDGEVIELDSIDFSTLNGHVGSPPAHVRCRCWLQPVVEVA